MSEVWKLLMIDEYPTGYEVSSYGSVRIEGSKLLQDDKFKKFAKHYTFDFKFQGTIKRIKIHRVVASTFIENPHNLNYVQHVDENLFNNHVDNLRWTSTQSSTKTEPILKFDTAEKIDAPDADKLVWKPLIFNNQPTGYTVSSFGSVKDKNDNLCKFNDFKDHYTFDFKINGETRVLKIHRLVALAFIENPNNFNFIQHVDGNPFNNRVDNLKWVSSARCSIPIEIKNKDLIEANSTDTNWRPVYVNGERTNYNVSNVGQIQVANTLKLRSLSVNAGGYATFTLIQRINDLASRYTV